LISATNGLSNYSWSNGATTANTYASTTGWYKVSASNAAGCSATDSVFVSIVKADILNKDTAVCKGGSVILTAASNGLSTYLKNGLLAYYPFNGNANDESGNGNNGTVHGASLTSDRNGNLNSSYSFDGVSNFIGIKGVDIFESKELTISAFIKPSNVSSNRYYEITRQEDANGLDWHVSFQEYGTILSFGLNTNRNDYTELDIPINKLNFSNGEWHLVTAVFDGRIRSIFLDGVLLGSDFKSGTISSACHLGAIGSTSRLTEEFFNGNIDELRVYNRALSPQEIQQLYNANNTTYRWSTGDTTATINVTPNQTTKYYCTISNGISSCMDSVIVTVNQLQANLIAQDTIKACGDSILISATNGLSNYSWSNGATTANTYATTTGWYKVSASNSAGCSATDSVFVSIVKADILNKDTAVCKGESISLVLQNTTITNINNLALFPGILRHAAASISVGSKGYFGTGTWWSQNSDQFLNDFWAYDPTSNNWERKADYPGGITHDPIAFAYNNEPYIGLGTDNNTNYRTGIFKFIDSLNQWTKITDFPGIGRYNSTSFVLANKLYICCGFNQSQGGCLNDFWQYDFLSKTWLQLTNFPGGSTRTPKALTINGKAYMLVSGNDNCGTSLVNHLWEFNPADNSWLDKSIVPGTKPRVGGVAYSDGSKLVFGLGAYNQDFYAYDPKLNKWDSIAGTYAGGYGPINFYINSKLYVGLGLNPNEALFPIS
jgi:N-acetylneuraminic acid mutarotase